MKRSFVEAVKTVMVREEISLDAFRDTVPKGFWGLVAEITGQQRGTAQVYGSRNRNELLTELEKWCVEDDKVELIPESVSEDSPSLATVDNLDTDKTEKSSSSGSANIDNVDECDTVASLGGKAVTVDRVELTGHETTTLGNDDKVDHVYRSEPVPDKEAPNDVTVDNVAKAEVEAMLHDLETKLTNLIDQRITEALAGVEPKVVTVANLDIPPMPPKDAEGKGGKVSGKKFAGTKADLRARIDSKLFDLLEGEAKTYFSGNMSRCLDAVLWRYYQKPKLSFED